MGIAVADITTLIMVSKYTLLEIPAVKSSELFARVENNIQPFRFWLASASLAISIW